MAAAGEAKRSKPKQGECGRSERRGEERTEQRQSAGGSTGRGTALPVTGRAPEMAAYIVTEAARGRGPAHRPVPLAHWLAEEGVAGAAGRGRPGSRRRRMAGVRGSPATKHPWGTHRSTPGMRAPRRPPDPPHSSVVMAALPCQRPPSPAAPPGCHREGGRADRREPQSPCTGPSLGAQCH